jgi:hypothetical protein
MHTAVMQSIKDGQDMDPPCEFSSDSPMSEQKQFERLEKYYLNIHEARLQVCGTLFARCAKEIQSRVNPSELAKSFKRYGKVGKLYSSRIL